MISQKQPTLLSPSVVEKESYRVLFLSGSDRDARVAEQLLRPAGFDVRVCSKVQEFITEYRRGAGALLIAQEALYDEGAVALKQALQEQETWSDIPVVIFTRSAEQTHVLEGLETVGNVTLVERPVRATHLNSVLRTSLRSRQRQYAALRAISNRDNFLAMLGHEIRNPVSAASLAIHILKNESASRPVEILDRQIGNLSRIIDDLLNVSRIIGGQITLQSETVEFKEAVVAIVDSLRLVAQQENLRLTVDGPSDPVWVHGDRTRLDQVVVNLISNAIRYTPPPGEINVSVGVDGHEVELKVADTGVGMPPDVLDHIFEMFAQAHPEISRRKGGLGIGLSVAQQLVRMHGGTIQAYSAGPGLGSKFIVRLPRAEAPAGAPQVPANMVRMRAPKRILVVDDVDDARELMCAMLRAYGYEPVPANCGADALESLSHVDAALLDIGLPDMDGYELARLIRERDSGLPLIAMTGYGRPEDIDNSRAAGFGAHLTKPVDIEDVIEALDRHCF
jgi:signal transduction histidine kinase